MSHNVLKLSKPSSQPSIHAATSFHSNHHLSVDFPKERESVSKDPQGNSASQPGIKKLAVLLNPRKERGLTLQDIHNSTSPNYTSPKGFLENPSKMNKLRVSTSTHENPNLNLISPKDLVRLAMSKHKPKASSKKLTSQTPSAAAPRNFRKSLSLRFGAGSGMVDKRDVPNKLVSTSAMEENPMLSRTSVASKDKNAKLRRMKLIYNDMTSAEIARLTRSTMYTPLTENSGRFLHDSASPSKSNSGTLLTASPLLVKSATNAHHTRSKHQLNAPSTAGLPFSKEEKGDKSSVEHMGAFLKEFKPSMRDAKRKEKKSVQARKMPSMENIKQNSMSFSRLMSHPTINLGDKTKSPITDFKGLLEEGDEADEILQGSENNKGKDVKPREEFIADLKNWVNDIVKPGDEKPAAQPDHPQKKNSAVVERVKEAQEGLLEKLRDALENDEFVRREDYERLYREKESIEDELDAFKEENAKLRDLAWRLQEEVEKSKQKEKELRKHSIPANVSMSDHGDEMLEMIIKQQQELEMYKKREEVVNNVINMIWKAGIQIGDLGYVPDIKEANEGDEEEEYEQYEQYSNQNVNPKKHEDYYENYQEVHKKLNNMQKKHQKNKHAGNEENSMLEEDIFIPSQKEEGGHSQATSRVIKALSELGDSESESSGRHGSLKGLPMNPQTNTSFPLKNSQNSLKHSVNTSSTGKLKIDLGGLGGNQPKKRNPSPLIKNMEKINNFIKTDGGQNLGFHEEFMSKLEEFSLSWRQAALANKKF